jgi:hypothetical protein
MKPLRDSTEGVKLRGPFRFLVDFAFLLHTSSAIEGFFYEKAFIWKKIRVTRSLLYFKRTETELHSRVGEMRSSVYWAQNWPRMTCSSQIESTQQMFGGPETRTSHHCGARHLRTWQTGVQWHASALCGIFQMINIDEVLHETGQNWPKRTVFPQSGSKRPFFGCLQDHNFSPMWS